MLAFYDVCQEFTGKAVGAFVGAYQNCRVEDDFHRCGR